MRKLAYVAVGLLVVALGWALAALFSPAVKVGSENLFKVLLGNGYTFISDAWNKLITVTSASGTAFLVYTLSVLVILGGVFWLGMVKLWANRPSWLHKPSLSSGANVSSGSSGLGSQTPVGATTRPTPAQSTTTNPVAPKEIVEEKESVET